MDTKRELYGHKIIPSFRLSLTDQVRDMLREEIHAGRWEVGERLPSLMDLVEMSGLSKTSILQAMEMLREEGYIRQEERKGTFLSSTFPEGRSPLGVIGVVIDVYDPLGSPVKEAWGEWRMHEVLEAAIERNYTTEVLSLKKDAGDWGKIDSIEGPFGNRVKGIISLCPFPRPHPKTLPPDRIPIVFASIETPKCSPCVFGDNFDAMYQLTRYVIEKGHRNIIFCGSSQMLQNRRDIRYGGYEEAMKEVGLPINHDAVRKWYDIPEGDLRLRREYLEKFGDATAIVCATPVKAQNIIAMSDVMGIRIPEDLSIVAHQPENMRPNNPGLRITGMDFNMSSIIATSFELLQEQIKTRECPISRILVKPSIDEGDSVAPPRSEKAYSPKL